MTDEDRIDPKIIDQGWMIGIVDKQDAASLARVHGKLFDKSWPETEFESLLSGSTCLAVAIWQRQTGGGAESRVGTAATMRDAAKEDPVGFCVLRTVAGVAEIITFGIVEKARRLGLGKALLVDAMDRAAEAGCRRVILEVAEDNEAARGLYTEFGFAKVGHRADYYRLANGRRVNALVLSKQIS